ncbi:MAG: polynucleotide adenylyltransferase PcnB [bacterium]
MEPVIVKRSDHTLSRQNISPEALKVLYGLKEAGYISYIAGGGVRDLLLGRQPKDFDVVTDATPNEIRKIFRNSRLIGRRFRLAHVFFGRDKIIEVATFRANQPPEPEAIDSSDDSADPSENFEPLFAPATPHHVRREDGLIVRDNLFGSPEEDALRRDFTVNALFYDIRDYSLIDYVGGLEDLKGRVIRFIGEPGVRCVEDPVRMVRAIRFAAMLDFSIAPGTAQAIRESYETLATSNRSRLYEEVQKLFFCKAAQRAYELLREFRLYEMLFPDLGLWLGPGKGTPQCKRISAALKQVDEWRLAGRDVTPALLFALMFGGMHESRAGEMAKEGHHHGLALHSVTMDHFGGLTERVQVPKTVRYRTAEILASQPRLTADHGRRAVPLASRAFFPEAVAYLEFMVRLTGENQQALDRVLDLPWQPRHERYGHDEVSEDGGTVRPRRRGRRGKVFRERRDGTFGPQETSGGSALVT